ncbi:MAG: DUF4231 domain-containing protein [Acidimicrobiales bacterium]
MSEVPHSGFGDADLPALFGAADAAAIVGQRTFLGQTRLQLGMLLLGATAGVSVQVFDIPELAYVGVAAYIVLVIMRVNLKLTSMDRVWYENRLIAESVRSLAWRYAVGGAPFGHEPSSDDDEVADPDDVLRTRIAGLLGDVSHVPIPDPRKGTEQITRPMRELRAAPLDVRRRVYDDNRLTGQLIWYADKAKANARKQARVDTVFVVASGAAVFFGLLQALGTIDVNLLGLAGMLAAVVTTWAATNKFSEQARGYAMAAHQLTLARTIIDHQQSEQQWAVFVNDSEDAISREHTSWRVARAQK